MQSLREILSRIESGKTTAADALAFSAARIAEREPQVQAFASRPDALLPGTGPLAGIACGVKDIIETADLPTRMGSPIYDGWQPRADAPIVMALKAAGATVAGKTHTTAFAFLDPAPTRNPHDATASPGGSSAGSAAAVAAGMIPLALGTQTGGSVIRPAAYCGVAAIKPSYALLPTVGVKPFSWSLDTLGLMAASADDVGLALAAISGRPDMDASAASLSGLRIGIHHQAYAGAPEPASAAALQRFQELAAGAGAVLVPLEGAAALAEAFRAHGPLQDYEATQALAWEYAHHRDLLPPKLRAYLDAAGATTPEQYDEARRQSRRGRDAARGFFSEVDVVVSYAAPGEAPDTLGSTGDSRFNRLWTLLGVPCATIPLMRGPRGLPATIQIIAGFGNDNHVIAVAKGLEKLVEAGV
ncbi:MAG TPA: amidase [Bosea sp. (in: a-proteobacteria)]|jgi:Asp-tRNA(Asn)/Glu-tRNA(Gln) amidotransferase A subunit family amidase|uniref:amidase n=1 Tax=Bosea sp. (in: a-proteobacteria) TaxID=1871050 RepID=UPI002E1210F9|nr:amidase [Bosea sp. (in: a-proteobacteria)]